MINLTARIGALILMGGAATQALAQNNLNNLIGPERDYFECVLECEAKFGGCFESRQSSLADPRQLLNKRNLAKLQTKEITGVYNCFRAKSDCHATCAEPFGREK